MELDPGKGLERRWDGGQHNPTTEELRAALAELDTPDEEHPNTWLVDRDPTERGRGAGSARADIRHDATGLAPRYRQHAPTSDTAADHLQTAWLRAPVSYDSTGRDSRSWVHDAFGTDIRDVS